MDAAYSGSRVPVGRSSDGAGVQYNDFSVTRAGGALESLLLELALDRRSVRLGCAAAKILYVKSRHDTIVAA